MKRPWLKRLAFVTREARRILVWALTTEGYEVAEAVLKRSLKIPRHDVAQQYLEHATGMNELYVALVEKGAKGGPWQAKRGKVATDFARVPEAATWRWVPTEDLDLPFQDFDQRTMRSIDRRLQPDALIECARLGRRWLIEYETGTATVRNAEHRTATLTKIERYDSFMFQPSRDNPGETYCKRHFRDELETEPLFVTLGEPRRDTINEAIAEYQRMTQPRRVPFRGRALTLDETKREFRRLLFGERTPRGTNAPVARAPAATAPAVALLPADMRLVLWYFTTLHDSFGRAGATAPVLAAETPSILQAVAKLHDAFRMLRAEARAANRPVPEYVAEPQRQSVLRLLERCGIRRL